MAVTSKNIRSQQRAQPEQMTIHQRLRTVGYGITLVLTAIAMYTIISLAMAHFRIVMDDLRYGRPRTTHFEGYVGHEEGGRGPTQLMAINLNRQVVVLEWPGGDIEKLRTIPGPYLFGAAEDLTPILLQVQDMDGDNQTDLVLNIRNEHVVYLNKDGAFRLPTAAEQLQLSQGDSQ